MENTPAQQEALRKHQEYYNNLSDEVSKNEYDLYVYNSHLEDTQKEHLKVIRGLVNDLDKTDNAECKEILNKLKNSWLWEPYVLPYL